MNTKELKAKLQAMIDSREIERAAFTARIDKGIAAALEWDGDRVLVDEAAAKLAEEVLVALGNINGNSNQTAQVMKWIEDTASEQAMQKRLGSGSLIKMLIYEAERVAARRVLLVVCEAMGAKETL